MTIEKPPVHEVPPWKQYLTEKVRRSLQPVYDAFGKERADPVGPALTSKEFAEWLPRAYRQPQPSYTVFNMEVAFEAGRASAVRGRRLVPMIPTPAMNRVMDSEGWTWEDLLAAAEAITEDEYQQIAQSWSAEQRKAA